ncbi:hypothetical protein ACIQXQ_20665 [Peribacillus sp. NPDC097198]|uniref:hypothetical protein n=1 Tax=Peribacillus sp. NPDC097198 TaxID=3364397 RepID=UPI0037FDC7A9
MSIDYMAAYHGKGTYSQKTGRKREPKKLMPAMFYHSNQDTLTDKEAEFYLVQHKLMNDFISKQGLIEAFNQFQQKKQREDGEFSNWFKKWN